MMKRFISFFVIIAMLSTLFAALAACGAAPQGQATTAASAATTQAAATTAAEKTTAATTTAATTTASAAYDWRTPYENTVTLNFVRQGSVTSPKFPEGDDISNNAFTRWILERFNLKVVNAWMTDTEYTQKIGLSIASKDIPDVMLVYDRTQLIQLIEGGLAADMAEALEKNISPLVRSIYEAQGGPSVMYRDCAGGNGHPYAIPCSEPIQYALTWIRSDWLEKLKIPTPTTMDELIDAARAFVKEDLAGDGNTIGINLDVEIVGHPNAVNRAGPLFGYHKAFPRTWHLDDATGKYTYGSITEETKNALSFMAGLYKERLFSPEFATIDANAQVAANYCGVFFGAWWTGAWPLADGKANNPEIEWIPIWIPDANGKYNAFSPNKTPYWAVVRNGYANPEAPVKLANLSADQQNLFRTAEFDDFESDIPAEVDTAYKNLEWKLDWGAWPLPLLVRYPDQMVRLEKVWNSLLKRREAGEAIPEFSTESFNADLILAYKNGKDSSSQGFHVYTKTIALTLLAENEKKSLALKDAVYPPVTDEFDLYWSNLKDLEDSTFLKIVTGEEPVTYFDTFREKWLSQGGQELIDIVNSLYK